MNLLIHNLCYLNRGHKLNQFVCSSYFIHSNTIQSPLHCIMKMETGMKEDGRMVVNTDRGHTTEKERLNYNLGKLHIIRTCIQFETGLASLIKFIKYKIFI